MSKPLPLGECVYLVKSGDYYKIGRTVNLSKRLKTLGEVELIAVTPSSDSATLASQLYWRFREKRRGGKGTFALDPDDVEAIRKLGPAGGTGDRRDPFESLDFGGVSVYRPRRRDSETEMPVVCTRIDRETHEKLLAMAESMGVSLAAIVRLAVEEFLGVETDMTAMLRACRVCGIELVEGDNCSPSYARDHRRICRPCEAEAARRWREANPEKQREYNRRRRALKSNATIEPVDELAVYERDGRMCIYCGATEDLALDHIVPLNGGGSHREDNLVVACRSCNSSKGAKPLEEWLETQPKAIVWVT